MLGDVYLTLGWVALQRLRHGPLWPWDAGPRRPAPMLTLRSPQNEGIEEQETAIPKRG